MFLDASAVVAILTREPTADDLLAKIAANSGPVAYSSITVFEAVIAIARKTSVSIHGDQHPTPPEIIAASEQDVADFLSGIGAMEVEISAGMHQAALDAARTFGRFIGHPARLNFGDCFSYASAKALATPLLFVGNDFKQTDIAAA